MTKQAVIIYGPPGSGKGTQAELLARKYDFIHFDTGRYMESLVHDPALQKNPVIRREMKNFDTGILCTPSWALKMVGDATKRIAQSGFGIAYSGSPRTLFEAFGDPPALTSSRRSRAGKKQKGLLSVLTKLYGKQNISVLRLNVAPRSSFKRNSQRFVCSICGLPILAKAKSKNCSFCDGSARTRTLDDPKVIKVRLEEYKNRTYPIVAKMKKLGFKIFEIDGEPAPYKVHARIIKKLGLR